MAGIPNRQYDISKMESEATYIDEIQHQFDIKREHCIHCQVEKYDAEKNTVDVKLLPDRSRVLKDNEIESVERPTLSGIPVLSFAHGGFVVCDPIFVGDTGYIVACDRKCSSIMEKNSEILYEDDDDHEKNQGHALPDDFSLMKFENGLFIPCSWAQKKFDEDEDGCLVIKGIGKEDGDEKWQRLILDNSGIITLETKNHGISVGRSTGVSAWKKETVLGDKRKSVIDPDTDLENSDAKFRKVTILMGLKDKVGSVYIFLAKKIHILADEPEDNEDSVEEIDVGVTKIIAGDNVTISPTSGTGEVTINAEGGGGGGGENLTLRYGSEEAVVYDGSEAKSFSVPAPVYPVTTVDEESNTFGINVSPSTGDVKVENTGLTGIHIQQSGSDRYAQITGGTDTTHGQTSVKTKDITLTLPYPQYIDGTDKTASDEVIDAILLDRSAEGSVANLDAREKVNLSIKKSAANCSLKVNGSEQAKFFGTSDVDISVSAGGIPISGTAPSSISGIGMITAIQYDISSHQLQVKGRGVTESNSTISSVTPESGWLMITGGQCTPHV